MLREELLSKLRNIHPAESCGRGRAAEIEAHPQTSIKVRNKMFNWKKHTNLIAEQCIFYDPLYIIVQNWAKADDIVFRDISWENDKRNRDWHTWSRTVAGSGLGGGGWDPPENGRHSHGTDSVISLVGSQIFKLLLFVIYMLSVCVHEIFCNVF